MTSKIKSTKLKLSILTLSAVVTFGAQAGNVSSTFTTGDTLTATHMTEIKDAVNDNDTRITNLFGGDGSAGDLTVSASVDWAATPPTNPYFNNITIDAAQTLTVPAGTTIHCKGNFTNNGTLIVKTGAANDGTSFSTTNTGSSGAYVYTHPGDTPRAATPGMMDNDMIADPVTLYGGKGGLNITESEIRTSSFGRFRIGGGAGAGQYIQIRGGGLIKIYCQGSITNTGTIQANGDNTTFGHGGGGGGIVILASRTLVDNSAGTISATGGDGGASNTAYAGSGGGGGGGIIVMVSPTTPLSGTETVTGGAAGTSGTTLSSVTEHAGGGGGGSGGAGGNGGSISSTLLANGGGNGTNGYVVTMDIDPFWIAH